MKLWLIWQEVNTDYDTYSDAVVAAETEEAALATHPSGTENAWKHTWRSDWAKRPDQVRVRLLGDAVEGTEAGVICASYNAG